MIYFTVLNEKNAACVACSLYGMCDHKYGLSVFIDLFKGFKHAVGGL